MRWQDLSLHSCLWPCTSRPDLRPQAAGKAVHRRRLHSVSGTTGTLNSAENGALLIHPRLEELVQAGAWGRWLHRARTPGHEPPARSLQQPCLELLPPRSPDLALWNDPRLLNIPSCFISFHFIVLEEGNGRENGFGWCFGSLSWGAAGAGWGEQGKRESAKIKEVGWLS